MKRKLSTVIVLILTLLLTACASTENSKMDEILKDNEAYRQAISEMEEMVQDLISDREADKAPEAFNSNPASLEASEETEGEIRNLFLDDKETESLEAFDTYYCIGTSLDTKDDVLDSWMVDIYSVEDSDLKFDICHLTEPAKHDGSDYDWIDLTMTEEGAREITPILENLQMLSDKEKLESLNHLLDKLHAAVMDNKKNGSLSAFDSYSHITLSHRTEDDVVDSWLVDISSEEDSNLIFDIHHKTDPAKNDGSDHDSLELTLNDKYAEELVPLLEKIQQNNDEEKLELMNDLIDMLIDTDGVQTYMNN